MKKLRISVIVLLLSLSLFSQSPQGFNYQAVVRDASGIVIENQNVSLRISLLEASPSGTSVYSEEHSTTTNQFGLVNLEIGTGTVLSGDFSLISWGTNSYFIQVELDETGGTNYQLMGTSQLVSVPYSLYANEAGNVSNSDTSATNELQILSISNDTIYLTDGGFVVLPAGFSGDYNDLINSPSNVSDFTNDAGYISNPDDADADPNNELQLLSISNDTIYLSNGNNIYLATLSDTSYWEKVGSDLYYSLGNVRVGSGSVTPTGRLQVMSDTTAGINDVIFSVQNANGDTVLAVYQEGVRIWVDDSPSGAKATGSRGGFAVGGMNPTKSFSNEYLRVTPDSVRVYIKENTGVKATGSRGGFAVGGYNPTKAAGDGYYFNIEYDSTEVINPSEPRMLWYPNKEAFFAGRILIEDVDSVGTNSIAAGFEPKAVGNYSQAFGYHARAGGNNSISIGNYANTYADNAFAFGDSAKATGIGSFAIGSISRDSVGNPTNSPTLASGNYSLAIGVGAEASGLGSMAVGASNIARGDWSVALGRESTANGEYCLAFGRQSEATVKDGIAIGFQTKSYWPYGSTAIGYMCEANNSRTIAVGRQCYANGVGSSAFGYLATADGSYSTALSGIVTTAGWGACAIQGTSAGNKAIAIGYDSQSLSDQSIAIGEQSNASSVYAIAVGKGSNADATQTMAIGYQANAQIFASLALGAQANAPLQFSTAVGNSSDATGGWSLAVGQNTLASGSYSTCLNGQGNEAHDSYETVLGRYAIIGTGDQSSWVTTDRLFTVGNGTATGSRSDAMKILKDGQVYFPAVYNDAVGGTNRSLYIDNTGKIGYLSSSKRYKKNILDMESIDWLYKLRPVNYTYKADKMNIKQYGFIAEEVEKINPLFVSYNEKGKVETVQYSQLISPMLKAIQNQNDKIIELEQTNKELEERLKELENTINNFAKK